MEIHKGEGPSNAKIFLVGEAWGKQNPFVGYAGKTLDNMLRDAGIQRAECYVSNLINAQPSEDDIELWIPPDAKSVDSTVHNVLLRNKMVAPIVLAGFNSLMAELDTIQPNVVIALGGHALWALTGIQGIQKWRGSELRVERPSRDLQPVCIPTHHPSRVNSEWAVRVEAVQDLRRAAQFKNTRTIPGNDWTFIIRPSFEVACATLASLSARCQGGPTRLVLDVETRAGHIATVGIGWSKKEAISIPFMCVEQREGFWSEDEEVHITTRLSHLLQHPNARVEWQNGMYDAQYFLRDFNFIPRHWRDTMISQHICYPGLRKALDYQASFYNERYRYWKDDGKEWDKAMGEDQLWTYNCEDCVRTWECGDVEDSIVSSYNLTEQHSFHQRLFNPVLKAVVRGVRRDESRVAEFDAELTSELHTREMFFQELLGHPLNPRSPKQLQALFYSDFKFKPILRRRTNGKYTPAMDDAAIEELKQREPLLLPLFRAIQESRSLGVFRSTFVRMPLDVDGRIRCDFKICGTETYRFSSAKNVFGSGGNLQNIPAGGEDDDSDLVLPNVRTLFIPDDGYECFDTDLSKADLRIVVWEADEREMKRMLAEGRDPYIESAREYYKDPTIKKLNADGSVNLKYDRFKRFSHGTHYLGSPQGLAKRINLLVHEVDKAQKWYFGKYPNIKKWQERVKAEVTLQREVVNAFGYKRTYFDRISDDIFRQAVAWIPQSTIAILIDKIWMNLYDTAPEVEILLQVHDSLFGQYRVADRERALSDLERCALVTIPYEDPLVIPVGVKTSMKSWGDCR